MKEYEGLRSLGTYGCLQEECSPFSTSGRDNSFPDREKGESVTAVRAVSYTNGRVGGSGNT